MWKCESDEGVVAYGDDPEEACINAGLEAFDLEPTTDEEALNVYVNGALVGLVWCSECEE